MKIETTQIPPGYGGSTLMAICHLAENGPCPTGELADVAGISTAAATGLVDRAETARVVYRKADPNDRRKILVGLTDIGMAIVAGMQPVEEPAEKEVAA